MENKELHLSIISPSDVKLERDIIEEICDEFNVVIKKHHIEIILHRYEDYPPNYHDDPQTRFEEYHKLHNTDIIVAILWYRLGTVLINKFKGEISKNIDVTGTEYEIEHAISLKKPLWLYRKTDGGSITYHDSIEIGKQKEKLENFLRKIGINLKKAVHSSYTFKEIEFKQLFTKNLKKELEKRYAIKIKLTSKSPIKNKEVSDSIHPNYLVGLYAFLVLITIMLFLSTQSSNTSTEWLKGFVNVYSSLSIAILGIALQGIPTHSQIYVKSTFKDIVYILIRKALFIIFFAFMLSIFFWEFILPLIQKLFI